MKYLVLMLTPLQMAGCEEGNADGRGGGQRADSVPGEQIIIISDGTKTFIQRAVWMDDRHIFATSSFLQFCIQRQNCPSESIGDYIAFFPQSDYSFTYCLNLACLSAEEGLLQLRSVPGYIFIVCRI